MKLKSLIAATKSDVKTGTWTSGIMARKQWPMRRARPGFYKWGPLYRWRVISFSALGRECRILLLFNESKQIFRASFAVVDDGDSTVLCDYEFHASEPGWHCHARCGEISAIDAGTNRVGSRRIPGFGRHHRRMDFSYDQKPLTPQLAFACAASVFGFESQGELF